MNETDEFDRDARDVIEAGREGIAPNDFAVERMRRGVSRSLHASARPMRSRSRTAPILAALGAAALGGALYATELVRTSNEEPLALRMRLVLLLSIAAIVIGMIAIALVVAA